jgi:hypothetical protein
LVRFVVRQSAQQHGIYDAKDRGVSANPQRERQYSDQGEQRFLQQHSQCELQVLR